MGFDPNGASSLSHDGRLNQFAVVIYIPDPLGRFLDDLRTELVPNCKPHAHVSVLPPRQISCPTEVARDHARALTAEFPSFDVQAGHIEIFPVTNVIYIELAQGGPEFRQMHGAMSTGALAFQDPFPYHPHITLAQDLPVEEVQLVYKRVRRRWDEYTGPRRFRADKVTFVQNTIYSKWLDLAEFTLGAVPVGN